MTDLIPAINAARASAGLAPVVEDARITRIAQGWAEVMAMSGLGHGGFEARLTQALGEMVDGGECIAEGQPDAASVAAMWLGDPSHREIVLGDWTAVGVGQSEDYWCADFARVT